ncbi:MAG: hypothetical protein AB4041_01100 [Microcystaceae cyanobacterium]
MTQKLTSVMLVLLLSLLAASCNREEEQATNDEQPKNEETASDNAEDSPSADSQTDNQGTPPAQPFAPKPSTGSVATLIPPTTVQQRRQEITAGRSDPYAPFPAKVEVERPEPIEPEVELEDDAPQDDGVVSSNEPNDPANPTVPNPPNFVPVPDVPPPIPVPEEAEAVMVSGILQLGGTPVAILTAPGDPGIRHVRQGATIAGGRVTVKSINVSGRDGFVILEQYGQQVTRMVGGSSDSAETSEG